MRYATAIWNYAEPHVPLTQLIDEFADLGYNTVSFLPGQFVDCPEDEARAIADLISQRDLGVTVHANFARQVTDIQRAVELFGKRLRAVTFDPAMTRDTRGILCDMGQMVPYIERALEIGADLDFRIGIEDTPLDDLALSFYHSSLAPLLDCPRFGMLLDVGHMNLRIHEGNYFEGLTVSDYIGRIPLPIVEAHLHDNNGGRDEHGHFGMGNIRFEEVAAALKSVGFDGISTIEIAPGFHDSTPPESKPKSAQSLATWRELWEG